ncbi:MAG: response regulator [Alphaproteobacteria bacterium]|nr:response regulator [Alphaproteobacteria bacterium]
MPSEPQPKILIADDHFLIRQFVKRTLVDSGMENVDMVNDGNEAIEAINTSIEKKDLYDIVFLDWNMPVMAGIDVLSYIRTKPVYQNSAVVMFTAESEKQNIMKAIKMGATSYILKPIAPMELNKKIREIMDWLQGRRLAKV